MQQTGAVGQKHEESAEADGGPEHSRDEGPSTDDSRYAMKRRRLGELYELLVLLITMTMMMMMMMVAAPTSPERRVDSTQNVRRHYVRPSSSSSADTVNVLRPTRCRRRGCCCWALHRINTTSTLFISSDCDTTTIEAPRHVVAVRWTPNNLLTFPNNSRPA